MKYLTLNSKWLPPALFALVSLIIVGPWLGRGYILTLDMVFTPELRMPEHVGSSYLFHALLHGLNQFVAADILQKLMLFAVFLLAGWGAFRLAGLLGGTSSWRQAAGQAVAGTLYTVNPFTYERLMTGQYAVLLGYSLLPWFAVSFINFLRQPAWRSAAILTAWILAISIVSVHTVGAIAVVVLIGLAGAGLSIRYRQQWRKYVILLAASAAAIFVLSSYWLVPLLAGSNDTAQQINTFSAADRAAFATSGNGLLEKMWQVLQLRGFWAERYGLFTTPWEQLGIVWHVLSLGIIGLVVLGLTKLWQRQRLLAGVLLGCILSGVILGSGLVTDLLGGRLGILDGYREPQKFAMLVALGYAGAIAAGTATVLRFWTTTFTSKLAAAGSAAAALALPLLWTPTMLWGTHGQLAPRQYPEGWYAVNQTLSQQPAGQALFLPWHLYFHTKFANRVIANPAPQFFDRPPIISHDPELAGASTSPNAPLQSAIDHIIDKKPANAAAELRKLDIRYLIIAQENDYQDYVWLAHNPAVEPITQTDSISLYRLQEDN